MTTATTLPWWSLLILLAGLGVGMAVLIRWLGRMERAEAGARCAGVATVFERLGWNSAERVDLAWVDGGLLPLAKGRTVLAVNGPRVMPCSRTVSDRSIGLFIDAKISRSLVWQLSLITSCLSYHTDTDSMQLPNS